MKKLIVLLSIMLVIALSGSLFTACGEEKPAEPVVLKMASAALFQYAEPEQAFVDAFNARCGPDYTIEYYPAESMVSFPELLDAVRTGVADMAAITPSANSADEPKLGANELPFLFNNIDAEIYACSRLEDLYGDLLEDQFNQKLLCLHNYTAVELISTKPVTSLEDWDGLLVQAISPTTAAVIEALGGAPVTGQSYTESFGLLEKNTVEGVITAPAAMNIFGLTEVASDMSAAYMVAALHGFSINLDVWNSLPRSIQNIMLEEARIASDAIDALCKSEWETDFETIEAAGVVIHYITQAEIDRWKDACQAYIDEQLAIFGDFGDEIMDIAEEANARYPR